MVIGDGFTGSGRLEVPDFVIRADLAFLLRPEFEATSFEESVLSCSTKLNVLHKRIKTEFGTATLFVGGIRVAMPALKRTLV